MNPETISRITTFSACRKYRYTLWREWDTSALIHCSESTNLKPSQSYVQFIGLNPSTADETQDDPTIRRCIGFARAWGYGALCMTNIFAWRDTDPQKMKLADEPVGEDNDEWLVKIGNGAGLVVAAWGKHGSHLARQDFVFNLIGNLHYLDKNKDGSPKHPLYLKQTLIPIPFRA